MLVQLQETRAVLTMMDRQVRAPKVSAKIGDISPDIVSLMCPPRCVCRCSKTNGSQYQYNCLSQHKDHLSKLPAELQRWVWSYLVHPADRLMLALSCKAHAAVFQELKGGTQKSSSSKKSAKAMSSGNAPKNNSAPKKLPTKIDKLYVLHRLDSWMPKQYKLCYECIRYRSKTRSKRKTALAFANKDLWSGKEVKLPKYRDYERHIKELKEAAKYGWRCPDCCERAHLDTVSAKKDHQRLKQELAKLV